MRGWIVLGFFITHSAWAAPLEYEPTSDRVRKVMARYSHRIGRCFLERKKTNPQIEKKFFLNIELAPPARVTHVSLSGVKVKDPFLEACVGFEVRSWRFPVSHTGKMMRVRYSYSFE